MDISLSNVLSTVKTNLSVIAKRLRNSEGKSIFSDITISTAEDGVIRQYITMAAENVASVLKLFGTSYSGTSLTITSGRWSTFTQSSLTSAVQSYAAMFATGEYLAMVHPDLAKKYQLSAAEQLTTVINIAHEKKSTTASSSSYSDILGLPISGLEYKDGMTGYAYMVGSQGSVVNPIVQIADNHILNIPTVDSYLLSCNADNYEAEKSSAYSDNMKNMILSAVISYISSHYGITSFSPGVKVELTSYPNITIKI